MANEPTVATQGDVFASPPSVRVLDRFGNLVNTIRYEVRAEMRCSSGIQCGRQACARAAEETVVASVNGVAIFDELRVFAPVASYALAFMLGEVVDDSRYAGTGRASECVPSSPPPQVVSGDFEVRPAARALR
eukprot:2199567-Rhodomonas_salina.1